MRVLASYIFKEIFLYFLICLVIFTSLIFTTKILRLTDLIINQGVSVSQVLVVFLAIIPTFLEIAIPLSVLLGVMLAFARLSGDSEIVVVRASGIRISQLLRPVLIFGLFASTLIFLLSFYLRPLSYQVLNQNLSQIAKDQSLSGLKSGVFNRLGDLMIYARNIDYSTGEMLSVVIDDYRAATERKTIFARTGVISDNPNEQFSLQMDLKDGTIHEISHQATAESGSKPVVQVAQKYDLTKFKENQLFIDTTRLFAETPDERKSRPRELSSEQISGELEHLAAIKSARSLDKQEQRRETKLQSEFFGRFATPLSGLLLAILAVPLGIMPPRAQKTWGASFSLMVGLGAFTFYFALVTIGNTLAEGNTLPAAVAVWLPNIILGALSWYMLRQTSSERWQSVADAFAAVGNNFRRRRKGN